MTETGDRRPLASRNTRWAQATARRLASMNLTPNRISQASMLAAALAGLSFWLTGESEDGVRASLFIAAALFCQLRLLCNLFDGMVAVEGGKGEADGPFWNEFPDRIADIFIFVGAGFAIGVPALGFAAATFGVLTAYVRELGRANGAPGDFSGPMAKQHRMATMTLAAVVSAFEGLWLGDGELLWIALLAISTGAVLTALLRARRQIAWLRQNAPYKG
ncbi:CDP-alcohol phosphatidyltransferase family protein [Ensifer sp. ENS07]|jgi:phosphatidylglycerophosphate synthase|uniref:CDP-alcohol phosphatidyltransferase family protein n=1 Tax=Ensifer adhaerens TaxID=106592 RepID=A0A9Q9DB01_ENSAD|nr:MULTISPECIES: CDP-alcohol phosphatidyltransferase family protein [Ensifer]MBD9594097.1 CDP-alcohol phosphatidyltransferase family protein [Ensifer sp. ENS05]MBD9635725.1 CDP-alcohol phosphatidyltransferase family protein [Ensifer sp. ENS07]USJ24502.1 CDP-alcohol phosphatidyltransferase family protein [Ensifer adhaerens]UTV37886.1 CDP-alcohol phosphatidyltransferase family protein [Ensifer adhaerens]SDM05882.1 Phosphatidylglycerophosphate synthase [Ensifer sp. YR511]